MKEKKKEKENIKHFPEACGDFQLSNRSVTLLHLFQKPIHLKINGMLDQKWYKISSDFSADGELPNHDTVVSNTALSASCETIYYQR